MSARPTTAVAVRNASVHGHAGAARPGIASAALSTHGRCSSCCAASDTCHATVLGRYSEVEDRRTLRSGASGDRRRVLARPLIEPAAGPPAAEPVSEPWTVKVMLAVAKRVGGGPKKVLGASTAGSLVADCVTPSGSQMLESGRGSGRAIDPTSTSYPAASIAWQHRGCWYDRHFERVKSCVPALVSWLKMDHAGRFIVDTVERGAQLSRPSALGQLNEVASELEARKVPGVFVEAGCALGGSAIVIAARKDAPGHFMSTTSSA